MGTYKSGNTVITYFVPDTVNKESLATVYDILNTVYQRVATKINRDDLFLNDTQVKQLKQDANIIFLKE